MCFSLRAAGKAGGAQVGGEEGRLPLGTPRPARPPAPSAPLPEHSGGSLGEAGRCLGRGRNQGCAEDQEKQVYRRLSPRRGPQLQASRAAPGVIKGARTLARHVPGYENQAGAPPPQPRGRGPPEADTEESSIRSVREIRDAQGGAGSALERRQRGTHAHGGGCHRGGKRSQARG